ncbi:hypothetical protein ACHWQZ_G014121 [Mnemiopsis leidyi]
MAGRHIRSRCPRCDRTGHIMNDCPLLSKISRLYDLDRVIPGPDLYDDDQEITVTTPGALCCQCASEDRPNNRNCSCVDPISNFSAAGISGRTLENITHQDRCGYRKPTRIQQYAIPIIKRECDVMVHAHTGSGKTAAYLIPLLKLAQEKGYRKRPGVENQTPEILIVAPTRELVLQIERYALKISNRQTQYSVKVACGGKKIRTQENRVREGCNVLIGTPGRVIHLLNRDTISLKKVKHFVLDEADRMVERFRTELDTIVSDMMPREKRQTLMFSATFERETLMREAAERYMRNDYKLVEKAMHIPYGIHQTIEFVESGEQKIHRLKELLERHFQPYVETFMDCLCINEAEPSLEKFYLHVLGVCAKKKIVIFVATRRLVKNLSENLADHLSSVFRGRFDQAIANNEEDVESSAIYGIIPLHGQIRQREREEHLEYFRNGVCPILVVTDVAARGLNIQGVTHVINYDLPNRSDFAQYIQRIGRTGIARNRGDAIALLQRGRDEGMVLRLLRIIVENEQDMPELPDWVQNIVNRDPNRNR